MFSTAAMLSTRLSRAIVTRTPVTVSSALISRASINAANPIRHFSTPIEPPAPAVTEKASTTTEKLSAASAKRIHIYTRTGDKGTSALFTGERRAKSDPIFDALGATDELASVLGLAREFCEEADNGLAPKLEMIQCLLQDAGANIATPRWCESDAHLKRTEFDPDGAQAALLERWIDDLEDQGLPPLRNFILPSGGRAASALHMARSVCRRAERTVVPLVHDGTASQTVGKYLNRLSDFLFTAARFAAFKDGKPEQVYRSVTSQQAAMEARASRAVRRGKTESEEKQ
ncbi:ATP:cob(I)alamin adenosyltransferase [Allomyces macrogynus ATCC 38327]|uniref:Corrinoid adenosyltransferase MMAB n=1 Tax=Allomyces macrogynus (strain ATCC 38327) TaxID=578462 RepID=A0A0L0SX24_ALLM3|nr:ATP:cob(I)alamin adenosyltransferase [Allomyces macrogynus ATCC 38327]|eukprot:KNE67103.1 ATP:cob(I)alamin adenosyltransferase [Allomyces macrogynus ATCC 38327]